MYIRVIRLLRRMYTSTNISCFNLITPITRFVSYMSAVRHVFQGVLRDAVVLLEE